MNIAIYTEQTIAYDVLGYDLLNQRALRDLRILTIIILSMAYWAYENLKPMIINIAQEIKDFDITAFTDAIRETLVDQPKEDIGYLFTTLRTYWLQLVTPAHSKDWKAFDDLL